MSNLDNSPERRRSLRFESPDVISPLVAVKTSLAVKELYTKMWLIQAGRISDLVKYSHATDSFERDRIEKETDVRVQRGISGSAEVVGDFFEISVPETHNPIVLNSMQEIISDIWRMRDLNGR